MIDTVFKQQLKSNIDHVDGHFSCFQLCRVYFVQGI